MSPGDIDLDQHPCANRRKNSSFLARFIGRFVLLVPLCCLRDRRVSVRAPAIRGYTASHMLRLALFSLLTLGAATLLPGQSEQPSETERPVLLAAGDIARCGNELRGAMATGRLLDRLQGTILSLGDHAYTTGAAERFSGLLRTGLGPSQRPDAADAGQSRLLHRERPPLLCLLRRERRTRSPRLLQLRGRRLAHRLAQQQHRFNGPVAADPVAAQRPENAPVGLHARLLAHPAVQLRRPRQQPQDARRVGGASAVRRRRRPDRARSRLRTLRAARRQRAGPIRVGIRQFVVGTGGAGVYRFDRLLPQSEVRNNESYGILKLTLSATGYDWEFVPAVGTFKDSGTANCVEAK